MDQGTLFFEYARPIVWPPVNGNWRVPFIFEGTDAVLVDYQDYH